ncbi:MULTISPECIES: outer membrane protein [unclassified Xanthobacter]|uniref:outer membrane protein n=1 Tax=unclassified Xanthobacter TaxID=2623496 RepID=UPI001F19F9C2|nr:MULTISPECIES: outer membrane protein [unclassified Xanthobacter]
MKRFLLATVALAALSAPAAAADLATKYPVKAIAAPVFSWTGFYIGANFGYGGDKYSYDYYTGGPLVYGYAGSADANSSGWFVGGQLGYNYQFANNVVVGLETDLQWANISGQVAGVSLGGSNWIAGSNTDYFGTIRARLGYAFDRFLPYITGGAAYGNVQNTLTQGAYFPQVSNSSTNWGWTIGAGVEYAITNNWTLKTEYLYVDLGSSDFGPLNGVMVSGDTKFNTMKAGVNYKF